MSDRRAKAGFVLPTVIVIIAVMTLALWSAALVLDGLNRDLRQLRGRAQLELTGANVEARVAYLIATEPFGSRGLRVHGERISMEAQYGAPPPPTTAPGIGGVVAQPGTAGMGVAGVAQPEMSLWFDNRPYRIEFPQGAAAAIVQIQDEAGLFNLNAINPVMTQRFVRLFGPNELAARRMADTLADFIDPDDLRRLNGAEATEYRHAGHDAPVNAPLRDPQQVRSILGWSEALDAQHLNDLTESAATELASMPFNIDTAPARVLQAWFDIDAATARQVIDARQNRILRGPEDVTAITGKAFVAEDFRIYSFPANKFRITVRNPSGEPLRTAYETSVTVAAFTADRPFFWGPVAVRTVPSDVGGSLNSGEIDRFPDAAGFFDPREGRPNRAQRPPG